MNNNNKEDKFKTVLTSIKKLSLLIPAKLPKEIKKIFKYFKNLKVSSVNKSPPKLYAQALNIKITESELSFFKFSFSFLFFRFIFYFFYF